ncbi:MULTISPECIES: hypothetical protein [Halobacteriales]|jgi:hypothetical protein|nr:MULTISPECIES: hypothetical protein [Halobacteriales]MCD2200913.1 hypothetical protein [Halobacterium sp. KA-4]MCD2203896.1 hypothetical protein [Halobacterium sp. KA-6]MCG1004650.1 hypothetical protein [Halobacterium noricense]MDL0122111.1 hypothetical protein [Halobacterium salinarum]MDL0128476.1 hypothetical protein [Halobacterium salinarum]
MSLVEAVIAADEDDQIACSQNCWNCGWQEKRSIRIQAIERTDGDEQAAKRASLIDEIVSEAKGIERITMLEDVLAEVRRQRRLEPNTSNASTDATFDDKPDS